MTLFAYRTTGPQRRRELLVVRRRDRDLHNARFIGFFFGLYAGTIGVRVSFGAGLMLPTVLFLVALILSLLCFAPHRLKKLRITWIDYAAVIYLLSRVVTEAINAERLDHPASYQVALNASYYVTVYFCARLIVGDKEELRTFLGALAVPSIVVSLIGVLQVLGVQAVTSFVVNFTQSDAVISRLDDGRLTRASSLIGHWSALGGYLCCAAAIAAVCLIIDRTSGKRFSRVQIVVFATAMAGILATFTFAVMAVGFVILIATMITLGYRVRGILILGVLFGIAWFVFGSSLQTRLNIQDLPTTYLPPEFSWVPSTLAVRINLWATQTLPAIAEQPWLGWGHSVFGGIGVWPSYPTTIVWPYPESEYIKTLMNGGVVELLAQVFLFAAWLRLVRKGAAVIDARARTVLTATFVSLLVASSINAYFTNQGVPSIWWPIMGSLVFAYLSDHTSSVETRSRRATSVERRISS